MVMLKVATALPPLLLAYTVNAVVVMLTVGVPERVPFSKFKPLGRAGWIPQVTTAPPSFVTLTVPMSTSRW